MNLTVSLEGGNILYSYDLNNILVFSPVVRVFVCVCVPVPVLLSIFKRKILFHALVFL